MLEEFVCIDPGVNSGWCYVDDCYELKKYGIIRGKGKTFEDRVGSVLNQFTRMNLGALKVYIEWPSFQNVIAHNTQSVVKLAYLIGGLHERLESIGFKVVLIPVNKWRGSCPKSVLWKRAERFFGKDGFSSHAGDAVSMAHWIIKNNV